MGGKGGEMGKKHTALRSAVPFPVFSVEMTFLVPPYPITNLHQQQTATQNRAGNKGGQRERISSSRPLYKPKRIIQGNNPDSLNSAIKHHLTSTMHENGSPEGTPSIDVLAIKPSNTITKSEALCARVWE